MPIILPDTEEGRENIHLHIDVPTTFEQQCSIDTKNGSNSNSEIPSRHPVHAPEKKLTLFALRLAVLEKAATGLGTLGFIWATVVLLGGFVVNLDKTDFWFITIILLIEGTRIFSRSHELEWQQHQQATWSLADVGIHSFHAIKSSSHFIITMVKVICCRPINEARKHSQHSRREINKSMDLGKSRRKWDLKKLPTRMWETSDVPIVPFFQLVFQSKNVSKVLYWLQLASATACAVLSLIKLVKRNFGDVAKGVTDGRNRQAALILFYSLALAEALLSLLEKAYWEWKVIFCKVFEEVNKECELGPSGIVSIRRFYYDAYSRCINGSIFDGLKMDMVSFSTDLLASNSPDEQLIGIRVLHKFGTTERFSDDTIQKIGTTLPVMERLVDMLNWKDPEEEEIRKSAAEILSKLASKKQNVLRVSGIPGAMESISSLLQNHRTRHGVADEIPETIIIHDNENYSFKTFNHLGLLILKKLARDHDNCAKIGNTRGLLPKIIDFSHAGERLLKDEDVTSLKMMTLKRSLQVLKMLASTMGTTGKQLRNEISEEVFTISNIRDILKYGGKQRELQELGIDILTSLTMEADAADRIGGTGGVLKELFNIFFKQEIPENMNHVRNKAGEALAMLAFESKSNGYRIFKLKVIENLVEALEVPFLRINAARILMNLCIYNTTDCFMLLRGVINASPIVLRLIMTEENKLQEVMVGLAAHVFELMTSEESSIMFKSVDVQEAELATTLVQILRKYKTPAIKIPRIRRFSIDLAIQMMKDNEKNVQIFRDLGMIKEMESVMETTSEIENFNVFSGAVGISRHSTTIYFLVETAMKLLEDNNTP